MRRPEARAFWLLTAVLAWGCAFLKPSQPLDIRYFTPDVPSANMPSAIVTLSNLPALRLRRVAADTHLGIRLVHREHEHEIAYYDAWRWSDRPEVYLSRAVSRELYEQRGVVRAVSGAAVNLNITLTAFEELDGPPHVARFEAVIQLTDGRISRFDETISVDEPILGTSERAEAIVSALSRALDRGVSLIADKVVAELQAIAAERARAPEQPSEPPDSASPEQPPSPAPAPE